LSSVLSNWPSKSQTLMPSYEARKTSDRLYNKLYHLDLLWVFLLCDFICVNIKIDWVRCWSSLPPIPILWLIWKPPLQLSCRWGIGIILSTDKKILILLVSSHFKQALRGTNYRQKIGSEIFDKKIGSEIFFRKYLTVVPIEVFLKYWFNTLPRADQFISSSSSKYSYTS
jgi:hypothetical protein